MMQPGPAGGTCQPTRTAPMLARRHIRPSTPGDGYTGDGTRVAPRWRDFPSFCITRTVRLRNEHRGRGGTSTGGGLVLVRMDEPVLRPFQTSCVGSPRFSQLFAWNVKHTADPGSDIPKGGNVEGRNGVGR